MSAGSGVCSLSWTYTDDTQFIYPGTSRHESGGRVGELKSVYTTGSQVWRHKLKAAAHAGKNGKTNKRQTDEG